MNLFVIFFLAAITVYSAILIILWFCWKRRAMPDESMEGNVHYPVTLLVPFRNEAPHLPGLLENLSQLSYPDLQVLMIDDHSDDGGAELVQKWVSERGLGRISLLDSIGEGKKAALATGVTMSTASIVLTTDADCLLPKNWVQEMLKGFASHEVQMAAGPVVSIGGKRQFDHFQQLEWASILLMTNMFFRSHRPVMCSGANMGYRKEAFYHVRGYEGNELKLSGDDAYLLQKIFARFGHQAVRYLSGPEALVRTKAAKTWKELLSQRARWAAKWNKHKSLAGMTAAIISFLFSLTSLLSLLLLFQGPIGIGVFACYWGIKVLMEWRVLGGLLKEFGIFIPVLGYVYTGIVHPAYVGLVAMYSLLGKPLWKGRKTN